MRAELFCNNCHQSVCFYAFEWNVVCCVAPCKSGSKLILEFASRHGPIRDSARTLAWDRPIWMKWNEAAISSVPFNYRWPDCSVIANYVCPMVVLAQSTSIRSPKMFRHSQLVDFCSLLSGGKCDAAGDKCDRSRFGPKTSVQFKNFKVGHK